MTTPTPEQADKLRRSINRLICRHGWEPFTEALAQVCEDATRMYHGYPEPAAIWKHRTETIRTLAQTTPTH